jgi:hypothetical protein
LVEEWGQSCAKKSNIFNLAMINETAMAIEVEPMLEAEIRKAQLEDEKLKEIR